MLFLFHCLKCPEISENSADICSVSDRKRCFHGCLPPSPLPLTLESVCSVSDRKLSCPLHWKAFVQFPTESFPAPYTGKRLFSFRQKASLPLTLESVCSVSDRKLPFPLHSKLFVQFPTESFPCPLHWKAFVQFPTESLFPLVLVGCLLA